MKPLYGTQLQGLETRPWPGLSGSVPVLLLVTNNLLNDEMPNKGSGGRFI